MLVVVPIDTREGARPVRALSPSSSTVNPWYASRPQDVKAHRSPEGALGFPGELRKLS